MKSKTCTTSLGGSRGSHSGSQQRETQISPPMPKPGLMTGQGQGRAGSVPCRCTPASPEAPGRARLSRREPSITLRPGPQRDPRWAAGSGPGAGQPASLLPGDRGRACGWARPGRRVSAGLRCPHHGSAPCCACCCQRGTERDGSCPPNGEPSSSGGFYMINGDVPTSIATRSNYLFSRGMLI